ncbi:iron ABC transporter permease [Pseudotabrizicola sp. 4114]|uniref:FecCD family ABC transporter permease n=1 Tax=Pseudotabrizicola sp. 4114 TaxID=2817731 RepID=UPI00285D9986|nr:iron complex transport system permease protein [Pseudorhodobacter sp. 4114]
MSGRYNRLLLGFSALALTGLAVFALTLGSYPLRMADLALLAADDGGDTMAASILADIRLPRILLAVLCGMAMALSGVVLQTLTRNPLAAPGLVGVEAGAGLTVLVAMILWPTGLPVVFYPLAALLGGVAVALVIAGLAWRQGISALRLLLVGVGMTAILAAFSDLLITYGRIERVESALLWLSGSLHRADWSQVRSQALWLLAAGVPVLLLYRQFNLFQLGEAVAGSRGLDTWRFQIVALFFSVMLTASAVANVGTMSFVGLLAPHAARLLVGERQGVLLPLAAMIGAGIVLLGDTVGRTAVAPLQIPAGMVVAIIGAPYVLFLLSRKGGTT